MIDRCRLEGSAIGGDAATVVADPPAVAAPRPTNDSGAAMGDPAVETDRRRGRLLVSA
ncbi:hypothetical protein [Halomonas urmiana]|uniref:hypothetical protein n=1 Tax=Halomonas urmiana TaxID=490901 RepID=UPI0013052769|nr:hypothetical protein [Halomonas urmiana]